jgi:hypothetical protein
MDKSWRVIFAFIGIFGAGLVSGVLLAPRIFDRVVERRGEAGGPGRGPGPNFRQPGPELFRRLTDQLNLTAEQQEKIKPIELRTTEELRRARREAQHNTEVTLDRMHDDIAAILTLEQRTQFDERIARGREKMKKLIQDQEGRGGRKGEPGGLIRPRDGGLPK